MTYVISDIHGNTKALDDILNQINLQPEDNLYILGDVIDRNPGGIAIIQKIMNTNNMYMLLGNHEILMLNALGHHLFDVPDVDDKYYLDWWYKNGGEITHKEFNNLNQEDQTKIIKYLLDLPVDIELTIKKKKFVLCHAGYSLMAAALGYNKYYYCTWNRDISHFHVFSKIKFIFGHTPTSNFNFINSNPMQIVKFANAIDIDTGAAYVNTDGARLACLRLEDMKEYYSNNV